MKRKREDAEDEEGEEGVKESKREVEKFEFDPTKPLLYCVDDDALILILELIPLRERFRLEMINRHWQKLCYQSWK